MSTVAIIYSLLAYRRDIQVTESDLIYVVNAAIRAVANRLYVLDSDLITGQMSVNIFSTQAYTASMVCVNSNPDTITDAASQFVIEGFAAGMPITTTQASNPGPFRIATVAAGTLTLVSTDTLVAAGAGSFAITSDDSYGFLPDDFWGLKAQFEPYLSGDTTPLLPLPSQAVALQYTGTGTPIYYKIQGTKIYVTPHTSANETIISDYYQRPTQLTLTTDTVPWNELFDAVITDAIIAYLRSPAEGTANAMGFMTQAVQSGVALVAMRYDRKGAKHIPQAINWGY